MCVGPFALEGPRPSFPPAVVCRRGKLKSNHEGFGQNCHFVAANEAVIENEVHCAIEAGCSVKGDYEAETLFESRSAFGNEAALGKEAELGEEIVGVVAAAAFDVA